MPTSRRLLGAAGALLASAAVESPEAEAGRAIYRTGAVESGEQIQAFLGDMELPLPAQTLPCAGCHGSAGAGRTEAGVAAPDITHELLTLPAAGASPRPAYTDSAFLRAVEQGVDPAGRVLGQAMPRYRMNRAQAAALAAYWKRLAAEPEPGIRAGAIRLGTLIPLDGPLAAAGRAVREALAAAARDSAGNPVHGRALEIVAEEYATGALTSAWERLLRRDVFALISPVTGADGRQLTAAAQREGMPVIAPLTLTSAGPGERVTYPVSAPVDVQAKALLRVAGERWPGTPVQIIDPSGVLGEAVPSPPAAAGPGPRVVLFLGSSSEWSRWPRRTEPRALLVVRTLWGPLRRGDFGPAAAFAAEASIPGDFEPEAVAAFSAFQRAHGLAGPAAAQVHAFAASLLFRHAVASAGRGLTRERLMEALDGLVSFRTGLGPALTFRGGVESGAYVTEMRDGSQRWVSVR